mgnify:CR=1 FL=1
MSILFINACVRENSRTLVLAKHVMQDMLGEITELNLNLEPIEPLNTELLEQREEFIKEGNFDDPMFDYAKQFAKADEIVIAAPFWDLSFPAKLKIYLDFSLSKTCLPSTKISVVAIVLRFIPIRPPCVIRLNQLNAVCVWNASFFASSIANSSSTSIGVLIFRVFFKKLFTSALLEQTSEIKAIFQQYLLT